MEKHLRYSFLLFLIITSCNHSDLKDSEVSKEIQIGTLGMNIPVSDSFIKSPGIDSYVAYVISNDKKDTFHIEYGKNGIIYDLFDVPPKGFSLESREMLEKQLGKIPSPDEVVFTPTPEIDNEQNIFQNNFYMYDTINGLLAKIVQPKRIGQGMTGMYIRTLRDGNSFSIYAMNLDSMSHRKALRMFKTVSAK